MIRELVLKNRSYRRFYQDVPVSLDELRSLVDLARLSPSAANLQPLRYILSANPEKNASIFSHLGWAGYLKEWPGPEEGERPAAYIVILGDKTIAESFACDYGIAAQSILLGAVEKGIGGCIIASIKRDGLREVLKLPLRYEILLVLALGKPKEIVKIESISSSDASIRYWRDNDAVHHVPKRSLDDLILP